MSIPVPPPPAPQRSDIPLPPPPPPASAPVVSSPEATAVVRRKNRIMWGIVSAVVLAVVAAVVVKQIKATPPKAAVLAFLDQQVAMGKLKFDSVSYTIIPISADNVRLQLVAQARVTETLYEKIDATGALPDDFAAVQNSLAEADRLLSSKSGQRLSEWAHLGIAPIDPRRAIVLHEVAKAGMALAYEGELLALRSGSDWQLRLESGRFLVPVPDGQPRTSFGKETFVLGDARDTAELRTKIKARLTFAEKTVAAADKFDAELAKERLARIAAYRELIKKGTLFSGVARQHNGEANSVTLEITSLNVANDSVGAALRNDGGWTDARPFQGSFKADEDAERFTLTLQSRFNQAIHDAGPLLDASQDFVLTGECQPDGSFQATAGVYDFTFHRVADEQVNTIRANLMADLRVLLDATAKDAVYAGAVIGKHSHVSEPVLLRFTRQENEGALLQATIESTERPSLHRTLSGTVISNRYRAENGPIRLQVSPESLVRNAPENSFFGQYRLGLQLAVNGDEIAGEDEGYTYRLKRASVADLEKLKIERAQKEQKLLDAARDGATYNGIAREQSGSVAQIRLRFGHHDSTLKTISVTFESREQPGVSHEMSGAYDPDSGEIQLGSSGRGRFNPSGRLRVPFFSYDQVFHVSLRLTEEGFFGEIQNVNWSLEFPMAPIAARVGSATSSTDPDHAFPTGAGAFVKMNDGRWRPLPTNDSKVTYGAVEVIKNISGFIGALSGKAPDASAETRPDKLATLVFSGQSPLPVVPGDAVVVVFNGATKHPPDNLVERYPELAQYPVMECAPSQVLADGRRSVDLFRIVPGLAGFRDRRVGASVEEPESGVTMLTCTSVLPPGTYAVIAGETAFEFRVQ